MSEEKKMQLSDQAMGALMMALQKSLLEQSDIIPVNVNIILLTPVEFIMIQVRVGAWLGATLAITALIIELGWKSELSRRIPKPGKSVVLTILAIAILSTAGLFYSWKLLTPMLLEYLADDAQSAGILEVILQVA